MYYIAVLLNRLGRGSKRRWSANGQLWVKLAKLSFVGVIVCMVLGLGLFAFFAKDLPNPDQIVRHEGFATKIYDRNGKSLYDVFSDIKRTPVAFDDIPLALRQATIAIEDKDFYKHGGFDPVAPFRIAWNVLTKRRVIGGSTLTQQLVKNVLLSPERTPTRKLKEFILTIQVERKYTKDQILQMYLNEVPYGGTAYGVESAAQEYFDKPAKELNLAQSVFLAGLPQSPTQYSPYVGTRYVDRSKDVLRRMREDGYINTDQESQILADIKSMDFASQSGSLKAPHFIFYVKKQLIDRYGEDVVENGGLRVTTSLDLDLQDEAMNAVNEEISKVEYLHITNGAAAVIDPNTGQVLAMVGSKDWDDPKYDGKFNVITQGLRQPGSSIKPVVYLAGLKKGYTAATLFMDTPTSFPGGDKPEYAPVNYDGKFHGPMLMREALGNSINIPAVKMLSLVGIKDMLQVASDMGISTLEPTKETMARVGLSVALGGGEIRPIEMFTAYSAFANGGKKVEQVSILKVTDNSGRVLEEWKPTNGKQVITPGEAFIISSILSDPSARTITYGPNSAINISGKTVAVKTGTTNDKKDNWTVGWTPEMVVGVWVGNNDNTPMKEVASGVTGAAPIWRRIVLAALKTRPDTAFSIPDSVVQVEVDKISGYAAHDGFEAKREYFIKGTEPTGQDPVHVLAKICKNEGKLATAADVASGNYDQKEFYFFKEEDPFAENGVNKWQEGILNWTATQSDSKYHPPTEECSAGKQLVVNIASPANHGQFGNDITIKADIGANNPISKVEFYVDNVKVDTLTSSPWQTNYHFGSSGVHRVEVRAQDDQGNTAKAYHDIGINQPWSEVTPTTAPTASPTP